MEVWMLVIVVVVPMTVAELVAQAFAVLDDMHEVLLSEECEGTEDVRLVDAQDPVLQLGESRRVQTFHQLLQHHNAVCRRFHAMGLQ